jgi:hypothetical protein
MVVSDSGLYVVDNRAGKINPFSAVPGQVTLGVPTIASDIVEFTQAVTCDAGLSVAGAASFTGNSLVLQNSNPSFAVKTGPGTTVFSASPLLVQVAGQLNCSKNAVFGRSTSTGISVTAQGDIACYGTLSVDGVVLVGGTDLNTLIDTRCRNMIRSVMGV